MSRFFSILRLPGCEDIPLIGRYGGGGVCPGVAEGASAQPAPAVIRGDAAATIGWLAANSHAPGQFYNDNWIHSLFGAGSTGWHWTDNLKTEVDFGAGTEARAFRPEQVVIAGRTTYYTVESRFSRRTLGISQQYQFFHNVWFHPHVAAGAELYLGAPDG